jgi:hypothetical protein
MKILGLLLLISFYAPAAEIRVKKMTQDRELDRSFILRTNIPEKVVLDCQSFIQGLRIGEYESAHTYMLNPEDCEGLQQRVKSSLRKFKNHCIEVEEDIVSDDTCVS